jgi:hypothetical protein
MIGAPDAKVSYATIPGPAPHFKHQSMLSVSVQDDNRVGAPDSKNPAMSFP